MAAASHTLRAYPRAIARTSEPLWSELQLGDASTDTILDAMREHPILIERPIIVIGDRAVVARPPERVLQLLGEDTSAS